MARIRIKIRQEHIEQGVPGNVCKCPVALAIKDVLGTAQVHSDTITHKYGVTSKAKVKQFVRAFDAGQTVEPFNFWLTV